jgi:hypothetical protein
MFSRCDVPQCYKKQWEKKNHVPLLCLLRKAKEPKEKGVIIRQLGVVVHFKHFYIQLQSNDKIHKLTRITENRKLFLLAQQRAAVPPSHCMLSKRERRARTLPVSHSTNHKQIPSSLCSTHKNKDHRHSAQHGRRTVSQNYEEIDPSIVSPWTLPRLPVLALLLHASREYDGKKMVEVDDTTINQKNDSTLLDKNDKSRLPFFRGWGLYVINSPVKIGPTQ